MGRQSARRTVSQSPQNARKRARRKYRKLPTLNFVALARAVREEIAQEHRFAHTVGVARLADRLAQRHGERADRARLAGLLHDVARLYPAERLVRECAAREMPLDDFERNNPIVLHARLGAELARERFGIDDPAVLSAIRKHTVAAADMSRLDAIVYLADALEPGRDYPERAALERLAFADLEAALLLVLRSSVVYLQERGLEAAPQTLAALAVLDPERKPLFA